MINSTQILWLVDLTSKDKEEETIFVQDLSTKLVQESTVVFDEINDDFISKHMTLRLRHKFEITVEESSDMGKVKQNILGCIFANSHVTSLIINLHVIHDVVSINILYTKYLLSFSIQYNNTPLDALNSFSAAYVCHTSHSV